MAVLCFKSSFGCIYPKQGYVHKFPWIITQSFFFKQTLKIVIGGEVSSLNEFTFWFYVCVLYSVFLVCLLDFKFGNLIFSFFSFYQALKSKRSIWDRSPPQKLSDKSSQCSDEYGPEWKRTLPLYPDGVFLAELVHICSPDEEEGEVKWRICEDSSQLYSCHFTENDCSIQIVIFYCIVVTENH